MSGSVCPRCGSEAHEYLDYGGCSVCRPREEREVEDVAVTWPEGGLPHGEHPHDYGYDDEAVTRAQEIATPLDWTGGYPQRILAADATLVAEVYEDPDGVPVFAPLICAAVNAYLAPSLRRQDTDRSAQEPKASGGDPVEVHPPDSRAESQAELNGPSGSPTSPPERALTSSPQELAQTVRSAFRMAYMDGTVIGTAALDELVALAEAGERAREALRDLLVHIPNGTALDRYKEKAYAALGDES